MDYKRKIEAMRELSDILAGFDIDPKHGFIKSPGKFEGEMYYVPYYWNLAMEGGADEDTGEEFIFNLTKEDKDMFPELKRKKKLILSVSEQGFVHAE